MAKSYTGTGDDGFTGWLGEGRLPKNHPRIEAVGTIDEATAALGMARSVCQSTNTRDILLTVQRDLYNLMAEIAAPPENAQRFRVIGGASVAWLEEQANSLQNQVRRPTEFIVPGDSLGGASLSVARTVIRRAERRIAELYIQGELENEYLLPYLNRLSSLCFVLELIENQLAGSGSPTLAKK